MEPVLNNGTEIKKESKLNIAAGCLFAFMAFIGFTSLFGGNYLSSLLRFLGFLALTITMFAKIRKPLACVGWFLLTAYLFVLTLENSTVIILPLIMAIGFAAPYVSAAILVWLLFSKDAQTTERAKKVWFLPGLLGIARVMLPLLFPFFPVLFSSAMSLAVSLAPLTIIITSIALFLSMHWYAYPNRKAVQRLGSSAAYEAQEGYYELWKHVLLLLFTFGIWQFIWVYKTTRYLNRVKGEEYRDPTTKLLLCIFVPFYSIYWIYKSAQRIDKLAAEKSVNSDLSTLCLVLAIFIPIIALILMQDKINAIATADGTAQRSNGAAYSTGGTAYSAGGAAQGTSTPPIGAADEIQKYKDLLDQGVITQEEFDAKKKQLLGL